MNELLRCLGNIKLLKNIVVIKKYKNELTKEDYDLISSFVLIHPILKTHNYYRICDFVIEMKEKYNIQTIRCLQMYYNINKI